MGTEVVEDVLVMINAAGQVEKEVEEYSAGRMQVAAQQPPLALVPSAPGPPSSKRFRRICVFCGSSSGRRDCYQDAAIQLGKELVSRKVDLVYGGGSAGLMGHVAQAVHAGGGHVLGIIPRTLMKKELTGETVGEVRAVSNMHQRKAEMVRQSDAFIALPGGYGTMEELLEVITWAQLGIHAKPVGLLNVDGYYDFLITFIEQAVDNGFIKPSQRRIFVSASNAKDLVQKLEEYEPVQDDLVAKLRWEKENVAYGNTNTAITATTTATTSNNNNKKNPPPLQAELAR